MQEVYLRVVETSAPPNGTWTSELWSGFPGSAGTTRVPGGGKEFTQAPDRAWFIAHPFAPRAAGSSSGR